MTHEELKAAIKAEAAAGCTHMEVAVEDMTALIAKVDRLRKGLAVLADHKNYDYDELDYNGHCAPSYAQHILDGGQP